MPKIKRPLVESLEGVPDSYVLNMHDVGAICNISSGKAGELCATGQIVGVFRVGRQLRIFAGDLHKHLESVRLPHESPLNHLRDSSRRKAS